VQATDWQPQQSQLEDYRARVQDVLVDLLRKEAARFYHEARNKAIQDSMRIGTVTYERYLSPAPALQYVTLPFPYFFSVDIS
jgi:hypothetical protein